MKHVVVGTAGHVDHGKTTLVKALTGTDTDRLREEQERGMTIDLGFAALRLPDGTVVGIVDVPGHERFLRNMLAGATGIDVVLLVVAADDGVRPQTTEHLEILRLLDVRNGVVALTKIDLVDREWADAVEEEIRSQLADTPLGGAPIVRISARTGKGIDALKRALQSAVSRAEERNAALPSRLPIDRAFSRPGFGPVATGTLVSGTLRVGDQLELLPARTTARVRGIQLHGQKVSEARAGSRVAVNLAGVETEALRRGSQLAAPDTLQATIAFDASLQIVPNLPHPVRDHDRVRIHIGTAEIMGRVRILDERSEFGAGGIGYVQLRTEEPVVCARGDRFVIRSYSPLHTLGGGTVIEPLAQAHRKNVPSVLGALANSASGSPADLIATILQRRPFGVPRRDLLTAAGLTEEDFNPVLVEMLASGRATALPGGRLIHPQVLGALSARAASILEEYHGKAPLKGGMPSEELRSTLGRDLIPREFQSLLGYWHEHGMFVSEAGAVRLPEFAVQLNERQLALMERIAAVYRDYGIAVPTVIDVSRIVKAPPDAILSLLRVGADRGLFCRIDDGQYYDASTLQQLKQIVRTHIEEHGFITVGDLRDLTASNRRFALQAMEFLDREAYTVRRGDQRVLARQVLVDGNHGVSPG